MFKRLALAIACVAVTWFALKYFLPPPAPLPLSAGEVQAELERTSLQYFLDHANSDTGLVRDNADNFSETPSSNVQCSMAATGFGLAVIANASTRGMVEPEFARFYTLKVLKFSRDHVARRKGWFLHFVDWKTGERFGRSEYSTIDSAIFIAGALYAAEILHDPEIAKISHQLYNDMDFADLLTDGGQKPDKKIMSMAYLVEEDAYTESQWQMFAEQPLLLLLGLGHPTHPLPPAAWKAWARPVSVLPSGEKLMGLDQALFVHQYPQLFIDFRGFHDGYANYFENSVVASRYHRELGRTDSRYATFKAGFWGLSAGATPHRGYEAWTPLKHIGIACLDCALASAMFMPDAVLHDAARWRSGIYADKIWGRYGFADSLDLDQNWISPLVYGISKGPLFLSLANLRPETSLWGPFMKIPEIRAGLERAGSTAPSLTSVPAESRKPGSAESEAFEP